MDDLQFLKEQQIATATAAQSVSRLRSRLSSSSSGNDNDNSNGNGDDGEKGEKWERMHAFVLDRLSEVVALKSRAKREKYAVMLQYLSYLITFNNTAEKLLKREKTIKETGIPTFYFVRLIDDFTQLSTNFDNTTRRVRTPFMQARLHCYIIVVALLCFDFTLNYADLARALGHMEEDKIRPLLLQCGLTLPFVGRKRDNEDGHDDNSTSVIKTEKSDRPKEKIARLSLPLSFPAPKTRYSFLLPPAVACSLPCLISYTCQESKEKHPQKLNFICNGQKSSAVPCFDDDDGDAERESGGMCNFSRCILRCLTFIPYSNVSGM